MSPPAPPAASLSALEQAANARLLTISAGLGEELCAGRSDLPPDTRSLILLSPHEPAFWPGFIASPEYRDGAPDPMDRWSIRVISDWAAQIGGTALFPFAGPPWHPFIDWALASGRVHSSPLGMVVHPVAGLFISFRGAIALPFPVNAPPVCSHPCNNCPDQPCRTACPVGAFCSGTYNVAACRDYLGTAPGTDCMSKGCAARRACPISRTYGRVNEHSAFHMGYFV